MTSILPLASVTNSLPTLSLATKALNIVSLVTRPVFQLLAIVEPKMVLLCRVATLATPFTLLFIGAHERFDRVIDRSHLQIFTMIAVASCDFIHCSFGASPATGIVKMLPRLSYVYSLLMSLVVLVNKDRERTSATQFWREVPRGFCYSLALLKIIDLTTHAGLKIPHSLVFIAEWLPAITRLFDAIINNGKWPLVSKLTSCLHGSTLLKQAVPIAFGIASGSKTYLALKILHTYAMSLMSEPMVIIAKNFWAIKFSKNTWNLVCINSTEENFQDQFDPGASDRFRSFLHALPSKEDVNCEGRFIYREGGILRSPLVTITPDLIVHKKDLEFFSLLVHACLPCFRIVQAQGPFPFSWSIKITKENMDFDNPKVHYSLRSTLGYTQRTDFNHESVPPLITLDDLSDLDDPHVRNTLKAIIRIGWGHRIVIPGFILDQNQSQGGNGYPFYRNEITVDVLEEADFTNLRTFQTLKSILDLFPVKSIAFPSNYDEKRLLAFGNKEKRLIDPAKIQQLPSETILPPDWIIPARLGMVSSFHVGNGLFILDYPPQRRIAVFDPSTVKPGNTLYNEKLEQTLSLYCAVPSSDIKKKATPTKAEEWAPVLNDFFADPAHPSTAKARAIARLSRQPDQMASKQNPLNEFPHRLHITQITEKWTRLNWNPKILSDPTMCSFEPEYGITVSWKPPKNEIFDRDGWTIVVNLSLLKPSVAVGTLRTLLDYLPWISTVLIDGISFSRKTWSHPEYISNPISSLYLFSQTSPYSPDPVLSVASLKRKAADKKCTTITLAGLPPLPSSLLSRLPDTNLVTDISKEEILNLIRDQRLENVPKRCPLPKTWNIQRVSELDIPTDAFDEEGFCMLLRGVLEENPAIEMIYIKGQPPLVASNIRRWPSDWEFNLPKLLSSGFTIEPGFKLLLNTEGFTLEVIPEHFKNFITYRTLMEIMAVCPIAFVCIDQDKFPNDWFATRELALLSSAEEKQPRIVIPELLLASRTLRASWLNTTLITDARLYNVLPYLNLYALDPGACVITLENVDQFREWAHYLDMPGLKKSCNYLDPDGAYD
jgi:hypothetical protein